jgi:hypothetical protein
MQAKTCMSSSASAFAPCDVPRPFGMPPFDQVLSDEDIAGVTYIRQSWGNSAAAESSLDVLRVSPVATPGADRLPGVIDPGPLDARRRQRGRGRIRRNATLGR